MKGLKGEHTGGFLRGLVAAVCLLILFLIAPPAHAYEPSAEMDYWDEHDTVWTYEVPSEESTYPYPGTILIKKCSEIPKSGVLEVPASMHGIPVTGIDDRAFCRRTRITELILPEGLRTIGEEAFYYCLNLKKINLPSSLEMIREDAFNSCSIESLEFPAGMNCTIQNAAFGSCSYIRSIAINGSLHCESIGDVFGEGVLLREFTVNNDNPVYTALDGVLYSKDMSRLEKYPNGKAGQIFTVPAGVRAISPGAFFGSRLKSIILPENLQEIGAFAFDTCKYLRNIDIPSGVKRLGNHAFYCCDQLSSVTLHEGLESIGLHAFGYDPILRELELPDGVAAIEGLAFLEASDLRKIYIPDSVSELGDGIFDQAENVTIYTTNPTVIQYAEEHSILYVTATRQEYRAVYVEPVDESTYTEPPDEKDLWTILGINYDPETDWEEEYAWDGEWTDENGTVWEYGVFSENSTNPYSGTMVIRGCSEIPDSGVLEIPASIGNIPITGIADRAFYSRTRIKEVILPDGLCFIGEKAFSNCSNLQKINWPSSLEVIKPYAFDHCGMESIVFPDDMICTIGKGAFGYCEHLSSVEINGNVKFKSSGMVFESCSVLREFRVNDDNPYYAVSEGVLFSKDMSRLEAYPTGKKGKEYKVPASVSAIGAGAFFSSRLKSIDLPDNLQEIEAYAFDGCFYLRDIDIPSGVKALEEFAFYQSAQIRSITLHEGLERIGSLTFGGLLSVRELELPDGLASIERLAFLEASDLRKIYIPDSVSELGDGIFDQTQNVTIYTTNPAVIQYAQEHSIPYVTATREEYRAVYVEPADESSYIEPPVDTDPGTGPGESDDPVPEIVPQDQTISCASSYKKSVGKTFYLKAEAQTPLSYRSSDTRVAAVSAEGKVTVKGCGTCRITVTAAQSDDYKPAEKTVTVRGFLAKPALTGKNIKSHKAKLSWSKVNGAKGYKLYVLYPHAKKYVVALTLPAKVKGVTHSNLSKGRVYRYRLRAYVKVGKKTVYSSYSNVVKVRIKK